MPFSLFNFGKSNSDNKNKVVDIKLDQIIPNRYQPRKVFNQDEIRELAHTIEEHGLLQPIVLREYEPAKYEIIAGERRYRAMKMLGWETTPAILRKMTDEESASLALIENLQRENLSPLEEAAGYMRLKTEFRMKQGDIAKRVGKSRAAVANSMRLLDLPQPVQDMLGNTFISVGHAKVLLSLKNKDQQIQLGRDIVNKGYTVRQTEKAIQKMLNPPDPAPAKKPSSPQYKKISGILAKQFGTPVNISGQGSRGSIEITFSSKAEFIRILELLGQDEWPDSK